MTAEDRSNGQEGQEVASGSADEIDAAEIDPAEVLALAAALVRLRTVNDGDSQPVEAPAAELLAEVMRSFGWEVTIDEIAPGRPNVVGVVPGQTPGSTLLFVGHTDVVTEGDPAQWSFDPFAGDVVDGMLRGRGSADMKSGIAAMLYAARARQRAGFAGRIIVAALADEEGLMLGAKAFARSPLVASGIDGVIVCEPEGGEICAVAKGALRVAVTYTGVMAHGAMPQLGRNPVEAMGPLLVGLAEVGKQVRASAGTHPELGDFYVTPTVLAGGRAEQHNVIPASAQVLLDIRTLPSTPHVGLLRLLRGLADQVAAEHGLQCSVDVIDDRPPVDTPQEAPVVVALAEAHRRIMGSDAVFGGVPGTTDGTILTRDAGLPTVVYGPGDKWIAHQVDEVCAVEDIVTAARVYAEAARIFLALPTSTLPSSTLPGGLR